MPTKKKDFVVQMNIFRWKKIVFIPDRSEKCNNSWWMCLDMKLLFNAVGIVKFVDKWCAVE